MSAIDQAAHDAVVFTLPLYEMARMRAATTQRKHAVTGFAGADAGSTLRWVNDFTHSRRLLGPSDREVVSPNNDTLYTNAWLDLSHGPLEIAVPDMAERYWTLGFLDMWTNPFAYAGKRTTGNRAQRLFVHGPKWNGPVPSGAVRIAVPGDDVWLIGRILAGPDEHDIAEVRALQARFSIHRGDGSGEAAVSVFDVGFDGRDTSVPDATRYLRVVNTALARNPAPLVHAAGMHGAALFGLAPGGMPEAGGHSGLEQAIRDVYAQLRGSAQPSDVGGGWSVPVLVRTGYGNDHLTRARVARNLIGALGIEEAMYVMGEVDVEGEGLDGNHHRYELRFPAGGAPVVDAFWSLTLYRRGDCLLFDNPINRYSIGDRTPGLVWDADGGLRIRIQADDPGPAMNWLPAPAERFYLTLRLYQPRAAHLEQRFAYPPVTRLP